MQKVVPKSHSKTGQKNDRFFIDFGVPLGSKMEPKIDKKLVIFQVGVPEGPRGSPGVDLGRSLGGFLVIFGPILGCFWSLLAKGFVRIGR